MSCVLAIVTLGLLNLYSATFNLPVARYFQLQVIWVLVGLFLALFVTLFDYRLLERLAYPIYGLIVLALIFVLFKGKTAQGSQRWISLFGFNVQPSELAKLGIALALAKYFHIRGTSRPLSSFGLIKPLLLVAIPAGLVFKQPDLGTAIVISMIAGAMILFVGIQRKILITITITALVAVPIIWQYGLRPYQKSRVHAFINPESDALGAGYQIIQSKIAIGSGELSGKGFLKGTQSKLQFLPKQHTDFVFSNFAEEFGFLGSLLLLFLFASLSFLGINVAYSAKETFGMMLAFGLTASIATQALVNIGMEIGLLPVVGVALPLFSYGGTSMLTILLSVGFLLNISMRRYLF